MVACQPWLSCGEVASEVVDRRELATGGVKHIYRYTACWAP
jgi:hypothetical protein